MPLPEHLRGLRMPVIAAPMTGVSGPELVAAAARVGVMGAFPVHNAGSIERLGDWLESIRELVRSDQELETPDSAWGRVVANLIVHRSNADLRGQTDTVIRHGVRTVITSVGSPAPVVERLHTHGVHIYADVATERHAVQAIEAGADGLVLLTAGAGGQTGQANPLAFVRSVRRFYEGPVVLAGGITDGPSILAALTLGADLVYVGTRFIATEESLADDAYRRALVDAGIDDVRTVTAIGGLATNVLAAWDESAAAATSRANANGEAGFSQRRLLAGSGAWGAGHSAFGVTGVTKVSELVAELDEGLRRARALSHADIGKDRT